MSSEQKPEIYISYERAPGWGPTEVYAFALAEDGTGLGGHLCSDPSWVSHDMGISSDWHHTDYDEHYPNGYTLVFLKPEELDTHENFQKAYKINQAKAISHKG